MLNKYLYPIVLVVTPLLFLPLTANMFTTPKQLVLVGAVLILLLSWGYEVFTTQTLKVSSSKIRFSLLGLSGVILINLFINSEGRLESLLGPGSLYLTLCAWAYFLSLKDHDSLRERVMSAFLGSTGVLALHTLLQLTILNKLTFLPLFMQTRSFTLTGNLLTTFTLIAIASLISLYLSMSEKNAQTKNIYIASTMLHGLVALVLGYLLMPGHELALNLLPLRASWNIALDSLKSVRTLVLGVGLSNFPIFYKSVKPLFLNATPFWNLTPVSASSELLQILTTTGVFGFLAFLSLPFVALRNASSAKENKPLVLLAILSGVALLITAGSLPVLLIFFTTLGLLANSPVQSREIGRPASLLVSLTVLAFAGYVGYYAYQAVAGEMNLARAQAALAKNDGKTVYEQNLQAISHLPLMTSYHVSYSQVNLSLAAALSQKDNLTETERQNVAQLVAQGVNEAKLATSLRPHDATTWQNLGNVYRNLVNVADGSDQFAMAAYAQAVTLDPGNPALRVEYGGLLYQLSQNTKVPEDQASLLARAQAEFQTALSLKSDYANAYYNLAKLLETTKDYANAYTAMQRALSLLGPDNPDLARATAELETLKTKIPKNSPTPAPSATPQPEGSDLATPTPFPSPLDGGPVDLPAEAQ